MSKSRDLADILSGNIGSRNVTTDGQKLDTIETSATADQTKADIDALNIDADTLDGNDSSYFTGYTDTQIAAIPEASFANLTGKPTTLAGYGITDSLEPADATILKDADIGVNVLAYDANVVSDASYVATDENFTTADHSKLDGIETGATADQTKADIDALNVDADTLDGQHGSYYTTYADTAVSNLVDSSPAALNTLNELAAALGDDANFSTTMTNALAGKVDDSQVLTNVPSGALFTDTNTTYSVGDGGLTQKNFTSTLKTKLDGIADNANNYTHPTFNGDDFSIDTGHLSGATVIDDLDINITTDTNGHVTDANATVGTRNLTLGDLGYTGATNANNYSHPTGAGNNHIPSGGATDQILKYSSSGTAVWADASGGDPFPVPPTWSSPDENLSSSGTWTKSGKGIADDDWVIFHLIGGGGSTTYQGGAAGGSGGAVLICLKGSEVPSSISYTIGAPKANDGYSLYGYAGNPSTITISGRTFTAKAGGGGYNTTPGGHAAGQSYWPGSGTLSGQIDSVDCNGGGYMGGSSANSGYSGGSSGGGRLRVHY